jgi:hypothetical protein
MLALIDPVPKLPEIDVPVRRFSRLFVYPDDALSPGVPP